MTLALCFWPVLACLVALSLWRLADELFGRRVAIAACLLCACVPAIRALVLGARAPAALLNGIEVAAWLGMPLAVVAASGRVEDLAGLVRGRRQAAPAILAMALLALLAGLAVLASASGAKAETARAWLVLAPVVGLAGAGRMPALLSVRRSPIVWAMLIVQLGTIYLVKVDGRFR